MKIKNTSFLLILTLIFQLLISSCNNINTVQSTTNIFNFNKKSESIPIICSKPELLNIELSHYKIDKSKIGLFRVTTNISSNFTALINKIKELHGSDRLNIKYILRISKNAGSQIYEREIQEGCNTYDLNNEIFELGYYKAEIYIKTTYDSEAPINYEFNDFIRNFVYINYSPCDYNDSNPCTDVLISPKDKFITSTNFEIVEPEINIPEGAEFFETTDFKNIVNYTNQLNVSTNNINDLYAKNKQLEVYKEKKISLLARPVPDNTKIAQINNEIANLESSVNSLSSSVMIDILNLNNRKQTLANHINTITGKQYITYDPADKPDRVGAYSDITYFSDLDITNLLSDGVTLYAPDEGDPDQDNLKEAWEVDQERVEILDPTNIFDASKVLSDEIQTAKDLITDFNTNSTTNDIYNNPEAIETLHTLINQIKDHTSLLSSRAKKYSDDYSSNNQKLDYQSDALKAYFLLQLAAVNNKLQSGDAFLLQSLKSNLENNNFSIKLDGNGNGERLPSQKAINELVDKYLPLAVEYFNTPLFSYEESTKKFYGYTDTQWNDLKAVDNGATTKALEDATIAMAKAILIPTTRGDAIFAAFTLFREAKALSKINLKDVKEFVAQAKVLKQEVSNVTQYVKKFFAKNPSIDCLTGAFNGKAFHTQGFNIKSAFEPCESLSKILVSTITKAYRGKIYRYSHFTKDIKTTFDKNYKAIEKIAGKITDTNDIRYKAFEMVKKFSGKGIEGNSKGIYIKTWGSPKFRHGDYNYILHEVNVGNILKNEDISSLLKEGVTSLPAKLRDGYIKGGTKANNIQDTLDFIVADHALADTLASKGLITIPLGATDKTKADLVKEFRNTNKLTWHHSDDLKNLQLVPLSIHAAIKHSGGESIIKSLRGKTKALTQYFTFSLLD